VSSASNVSAAHFPRPKTCHLSAKFVEDYSAANVAIAIVHEATHARVGQAGIPLYPDLRSRIERRCVREEIAFAQRLPRTDYPGIDVWIGNRRQSGAVR
jgi:hypothetical protein